MYYQSKRAIQWKKKDYSRTILLFALHTFIIIALYAVMLFVNAYKGEVDTSEFLMRPETVRKLLYVAIAVVLLAAGIYLYFYNENRDFILRSKNIHLVFIVIEVSILAMYIAGLYLNVQSRPFALCALLMLLLINKRSAIFINGVTCIYMFLADAFLAVAPITELAVYSALVINYTTSLLAIYIVGRVGSRLKVFVTGFIIAVPIALSYAVLDFDTFIQKPYQAALDGLWSGMLSVVLMMAMLPFFERVFNVLTDYRLTEITDHKSVLIKALHDNAPGTFNHSLIVSTLAESCATAIGENPLLARTCAYYHDIGKLRRPDFFKENQADGTNPHDDLTPELSANIIKAHATDGYQLMMKNRMPQIIADVCLQHHGTLPIIYFYDKAKKFTDGEVSLAQYRYPGPKPQTKIAAIIMIADGCEAAARALPDRSREKVYAVVKKLVSDRMEWGQFDECEITLKELNIIINTVVNSLTGVYHSRIEYPKISLDKIEDGAEEKKDEA